MSNEEMNKNMEFIVEQTSKFAAEIEITREVQAADAKRFREELEALKEQDRILSEALLAVVGLVGRLTEAQTRTDEQINRTDEQIELLVQAQKRTEERLNIFINVVERHIGGNGGAENTA
jgi:hypothetical protein